MSNHAKGYMIASLYVGLSAIALTAGPVGAGAQEMDHSQHQTHQGQAQQASEAQQAQDQHQGHDMSGMSHQMTPEQMKQLRAKIPLYDEYTDDQIMMGMSRMKNSSGVLSDAALIGDVGVLALAHGFNERGNEQFTTAFETVKGKQPTAYAFGMAMMTSDHIQTALTNLEAAGAKTIVVIPTTTADNSTLIRQWDYIFNKHDTSAYLDVPRAKTNANLVFAPTPTAHPIMGEILLDYAKELSTDPANELVILMGHGPQSEEDNAKELEIMGAHADYIKEQGGFADVKFANVQDDAPKSVRAANVEIIRGWAKQAVDAGKGVVVVTTALTDSGVVGRMQADVDGTGAKFNSKGLMEHARFKDWLDDAVKTALSAAAMRLPISNTPGFDAGRSGHTSCA